MGLTKFIIMVDSKKYGLYGSNELLESRVADKWERRSQNLLQYDPFIHLMVSCSLPMFAESSVVFSLSLTVHLLHNFITHCRHQQKTLNQLTNALNNFDG